MEIIPVLSGETVSGLTLTSEDILVVSGGTALETQINEGTMNVLLSGAYVSDTVMSGGEINANNGQIEKTVIENGSFFASGFAVVSDTTVKSGGSGVFRGAKVDATVIDSYGSVGVFGGTVTNTTVNCSGRLSLANSSTLASHTLVSGSGHYRYAFMTVGYAASAYDTTIMNGGLATVSGLMSDFQVSQGGQVTVSGGTVNAGTIQSGGTLYLSGAADDVTVNYGGYLGANGNFASGTRIVENGGRVHVGSADKYDYTNSRWVYTPVPMEFASNTFSGLVYRDYGWGTVHSGTTAVDITAYEGGLMVYSGGVVNGYTAQTSSWTETQTSWINSSSYNSETGDWDYTSEAVVSNVTITGVGGLQVLAGGTVTGFVYESQESSDPLYDGNNLVFQIDSDTLVSGTLDGSAFDIKDGKLSNTALQNAVLEYLGGANVKNVSQTFGSASFLGDASGTDMVYSATSISFSSGAVVNGVTARSVPYTFHEEIWDWHSNEPTIVEIDSTVDVNASVFAGASVTGLDMDETTYLYMEVAQNTILQGTSGGVAIDMHDGYFGDASLGKTTVVVFGPTSSGTSGSQVSVGAGTVGNLTVNMGAKVTVLEGATAMDMVENGGAVDVAWDYEEDRALATCSFASNTFSYRALTGYVTVHQNTVASDNIFFAGELNVFSGGVVKDFYTYGSGMAMKDLNFNSGAIIMNLDTVRYNTTEYHPGHTWYDEGLNVSCARLTDLDEITMYVSPETNWTNASLDDRPFSMVNGVLSGFVADVDGSPYSDMINVMSGGKMVDCYIDAWGQIELYDGASASNVTFASNYIMVSSGAVLENATIGLAPVEVIDGSDSRIEDKNAFVYALDGAVVRNFSLNGASTLEAYGSGTVLTGSMSIADDSYVYIYDGAVIDFNIADMHPSDGALIDNFQNIVTNKDNHYTITFDLQQAKGQYLLSQNTIFEDYMWFDLYGTDGTYYATLSVYPEDAGKTGETGGNTYVPGFGVTFMLNLTADYDLVLTIDSEYDAGPAPIAAPTVTPRRPGADDYKFTCDTVILTATYDESVVAKEYSNDGGVSWEAFTGTVAVSENCQLQFRGANAEGVYTDVATFTVSNIDMVAPTDPESLSVNVEDNVAMFYWDDPTDDYSGVKGFVLALTSETSDAVVIDLPWHYANVVELEQGTWHWTVQAYDYAGNFTAAVAGEDFVISEGPTPPTPSYVAKSDIDGNGISDVMFVWTGTPEQPGNYQHGYWMNGTSEWQSQNGGHPADWENLGCYDMSGDGKADSVLVGNVVVNEVKGAYIGYYADAIDAIDGSTWVNIGYLNNADDITWKNKVGNLTGNASGANSIVWHTPDLGALGAWVDGTDTWASLGGGYDSNWTLIGCGDFDGDGKDAVVMAYNSGEKYYAVNVDGTASELANSDSGWEVRAIGDFSGDSKDDIVAFHAETGLVAMWGDGDSANWSQLGQLDASDWFVVGCGDYDGDMQDDLLVRQNSTGMLGYYSSGDMAQWNTLGYGVDMAWTVIA